jgi:hypothetical protein
MCFTHDYDWCAEVCDETTGAAEKATVCDECHKPIPAGVWVRSVYQQQHEQCQRCEDEDSRDFEEDHPDCAGDEHEYGETFDWDCCEACDKVLRAIKAAELEEGCKEYESQPALTELSQAMSDDRLHNDGRYLAKVLAMFPEVAAHARTLAGDDE